jgi:hypothetical protein
MQFLERITEKIVNSLRDSHEVIVTDIAEGRPVVALGVKTQLLPASAANPADPFYHRWAEAVATLIGKHLCGPYIPGAKLQKDPIPLCNFPDVDTSSCEYRCAPILVLGFGYGEAYLPPCHAKESPHCAPYVNETVRCVMVKSIGCQTIGARAHNREYTVNYLELWYEDKRLLKVELEQPFQKARDQIAYIYLQVDFPYDMVG